MHREEVLEKLAANLADIRTNFQVADLAVFGSVARNEAGAGSDIDLLVDFSQTPGLFKFMALKRHLEEVLGSEVDLVTRKALKRQLREKILSEAVRVR